MARRATSGGSRDGDESGRRRGEREREYREHERGQWDDPEEHERIERRRFEGGLPPTPELYARARKQWSRLPRALVRPSMNPGLDDPSSNEPQSPGNGGPVETGPEQ